MKSYEEKRVDGEIRRILVPSKLVLLFQSFLTHTTTLASVLLE